MVLRLGQKVSIVDQAERGIIIEINGHRALVMHEDGFDEWYPMFKLVGQSEISIEEPSEDKHQDSYVEVRQERVHEVDLHIDNLKIDWKSIPKDKILSFQISSLYDEIQYARKNKYDVLIIIHGKGTGVLKQAVLDVLYQKGLHEYSTMTEGKYKDAALRVRL
jgi:dsDNA-specific endonuclease/ATPase MutS2